MPEPFDVSVFFAPAPGPIKVEVGPGVFWTFRALGDADELYAVQQTASRSAKALTQLGIDTPEGKVKFSNPDFAQSVYVIALLSVEPKLEPVDVARLFKRNFKLFNRVNKEIGEKFAVALADAEVKDMESEKNASTEASGTGLASSSPATSSESGLMI